MVQDRPGVIAAVSKALAEERISLESMLQRGRSDAGEVPVVLTTHETEEARMQRALSRIAKIKAVAEEPLPDPHRIILTKRRVDALAGRTRWPTLARWTATSPLEAVRVTEPRRWRRPS
jgi:predicted amino acid-binding ACT domain protein